MPVRLILVLLLILFEGAFIGFNLENVCDVWLFNVFEAVPVYITVLFSFAAGVLLSMLFFAFGRKKKREPARAAPPEGKKQRFREKRKGKGTATGGDASLQKETISFDYSAGAGASAPNSAVLSAPDSPGGNQNGNPQGES